jgi:hypothetical protein
LHHLSPPPPFPGVHDAHVQRIKPKKQGRLPPINPAIEPRLGCVLFVIRFAFVRRMAFYAFAFGAVQSEFGWEVVSLVVSKPKHAKHREPRQGTSAYRVASPCFCWP